MRLEDFRGKKDGTNTSAMGVDPWWIGGDDMCRGTPEGNKH